MTKEIRERQLGFRHDEALDNFQAVVGGWLVPFLKEWINAGSQPVLGEADVRRLQERLSELFEQKGPLPSGYEWLPELAQRLSGAMRFNRRNFVNIHPTPHVPAVLASTLVSLQNPNNIVEHVSEQTTKLEREVIAWMAKNLVGFSEGAWGNMVSGGTVANMTALLAARDYSYRKISQPRPVDVRSRGLYGLPQGVVLATKGSHYSVKKALWFLGMGDENVIPISVCHDELVRRQVQRDQTFISGIRDKSWSEPLHTALNKDKELGDSELENFYSGKQRPFGLQPLNSEILKSLYGCFVYGTPLIAYVFTIGTTDTGTIEKPNGLALELLEKEDIYIHADAAAGGFAMLHQRVRSMVNGLERVRSVTIDGHKLGHLPYPNGAIIFRERGWMHEILHDAPYLRDLAPTLEGSRPGSHAGALWAAIKDMDSSRIYVRWLDRLFDFISCLVKGIESGRKFQVLHEVHLTTVAVAPLPHSGSTRRELNELVLKIHELIDNDKMGNAFLVNIDKGLSGIKVRNDNLFSAETDISVLLEDVYCLRIVATNPAVEPNDADELLSYLDEKLTLARIALNR